MKKETANEKTNLVIRLKGVSKIQEVLNGVMGLNSTLKVSRLHKLDNIVNEVIASLDGGNKLLPNDIQTIEQHIIQDLAKKSEVKRRIYQTYLLEIADVQEAQSILRMLEDNEYVEKVELDQTHSIFDFSTDTLEEMAVMETPNAYAEALYALRLLEVEKAWKYTKGKDVIVAVVDTGVNYNHPDIVDNMWVNEKNEHGYNFVDNNADPFDDLGHGTHVAGTIAANGASESGVVGVAPKAKIMAVKGFGTNGISSSSILAACIHYAADNNAAVINNSWGPGNHFAIIDAIDYAHELGAIVVFAAGNKTEKVTPETAAGRKNTISVAATDSQDKKVYFSNYGDLVDLAAPGYRILSLDADSSGYIKKDGTSMAAPHVSGEIALILAYNPYLDFDSIKSLLKKNVDGYTALQNKSIGTGRINIGRAIEELVKSSADAPLPPMGEEEEPPVSHYQRVVNYSVRINVPKDVFELELELENSQTFLATVYDVSEIEAMTRMIENSDCFVTSNSEIIFKN